ncbi:hypothetical protein Dsin_019424 [Dipteronia sinensis]|uniref:Uncharacterized protein n=1 Tax=Dipteronia sinensis TaxID=43782 RepID=A0AAE0E2T6_9ROSI|nr:hypothetical protein Dsin_019424 [Dipteronia sinensis]
MDDQTQPSPEKNSDETVEIELSSTVLDLTSFQLHDLASVELPPTLTELDLTANRLSSLDPRISHLSNLTNFSFRQNLIDDAAVEPVSRLVSRSLLCTDCPKSQTRSRNSMCLKTKFLRLKRSTTSTHLQILELGSNRLQVMENLQNLSYLQELWLGRNRIKAVDLCGFKCIKKISLQSNRLTSKKGFEDCVALAELYFSHNGISKMEGLSTFVNLKVLDVSSNKLTSVDDIQSLPRLEDLWLNDNQIESLESIAEAVAGSRETQEKSLQNLRTMRQNFPNMQPIDSDILACLVFPSR